jgi:hypothetical protein
MAFEVLTYQGAQLSFADLTFNHLTNSPISVCCIDSDMSNPVSNEATTKAWDFSQAFHVLYHIHLALPQSQILSKPAPWAMEYSVQPSVTRWGYFLIMACLLNVNL